MANKINVLEVGPRDGWQNLKQMLTFEQKLELIGEMFDAGVQEMEVTSFVSPKAIPQMADASELAKACIEKYPNRKLYALAPNFRGVENAVNAGITNISYVISVSESHNKANIRRTHEESLAELQKIMDTFPQADICVSLATVFGCPFEGIPPIQKPVDFVFAGDHREHHPGRPEGARPENRPELRNQKLRKRKTETDRTLT